MSSTVIGGKNNISVFKLALGFQGIENGDQSHIHFLHHTRVGNVFSDGRFLVLDSFGILAHLDPTLLGSFEGFLRAKVGNVGSVMGYHHEEGLLPCVLLHKGSGISHERIHPFRVIGRERSLVLDRVPIGAMAVPIASRFARVLIGHVVTRILKPAHGATSLPEMSGDVISS